MLGVLGDLVEDIVVWLAEPLQEATDTEVTLFRHRGGSAAHVAAFAARAGCPARFLGCVGEDPAGDALIAGLRGDGVDVRVARAGTTGAVVVLVAPGGERTMLPSRAAATLLGHVPDGWLDGLTHLHVPAYTFAVEPAASAARDALTRFGGTVSFDASSAGLLRTLDLASLVDAHRPAYVFANRDEAAMLGPLEGTTLVVKNGAEPTRVGDLVVPVPPVEDVKDATGAGDAFAAGFLAATLAGTALREAVEHGHALAATVLRSPGASA